MASPVGEDCWVAYLDEARSKALNLQSRVNVVEQHKRAVADEPGSLRIWLAYCDYFWSLWSATEPSAELSAATGWTEEERTLGRELFTFNAALELWQRAYEAIKYRLDDSHVLWDRWVSLELDLLAKTKTPEGVKRITHLFRNRLSSPHLTWDETAQKYSGFLTEYNRAAYEESMQDITAVAQDTKRLIAAREPYELKLRKAHQMGDSHARKTVMTEYLDWEMAQSKRNNDKPEIGMDLCRGLYARALSVIFAEDENIWQEYIVYVSSASNKSQRQPPEAVLDILRRAVQHCPWSGVLWNRYIICAEEANLAFADIEAIKHAATSSDQLYKNGMESLIEMYLAWCGFLRRNAMSANAKDEDVDVADVGLIAALEDVAVIGQRLYGKDYQGDPQFRLERVYIQYLTEKKGSVDEARAQWNKLASVQLHADSHQFWLQYYFWEMTIFSSGSAPARSPTPNIANGGPLMKAPFLATAVLDRAIHRRTLDWPERILELYSTHCNDYESSTVIRRAMDSSHKAWKGLRRRREQEEQEKLQAYAAHYGNKTAEQQMAVSTKDESSSPSGPKRKRDEHTPVGRDDAELSTKRRKSNTLPNSFEGETKIQQAQTDQSTDGQRDRENNTIIVKDLPVNITQTKVRQYFKEYGHINSIVAMTKSNDGASTIALIEFRSAEEAVSALLRDQKYLDKSQLSVQSGHDLTIYVTNFPPIADEEYIRGLFKACGGILSVRWPSLKVNSHRRFCYVSFEDRESSAKAVEKDGSVLEGSYTLIVKYSDPSRKKKRDGALAEGREIQITNLDHAVTEEELREVVSKIGTATRINIPRTLGGRGRGIAYVDLKTKDSADKTVSILNNTKLRSSIIKVEVTKVSKAKPSARNGALTSATSPAPSSNDAVDDEILDNHSAEDRSKPSQLTIQSRTIALMGLPETVNDARVKALVEPFGSIIQLVLQPARGGAKIEFSDAATAGKASMYLNNMEFEGCQLRTGSLEDLRTAKAEHKDDRIVYGSGSKGKKEAHSKPKSSALEFLPASSAARRPTIGKRGFKMGIGMVGRNGNGSGQAHGALHTNGRPPKSNADFRAMVQSSDEHAKKTEHQRDSQADSRTDGKSD